jgi:hypothetical protein
LADVLAYPVKQYFLVNKGCIEDPGEVFGKKMARAAWDRLNRNERTGSVEGYGLVWLPRK